MCPGVYMYEGVCTRTCSTAPSYPCLGLRCPLPGHPSLLQWHPQVPALGAPAYGKPGLMLRAPPPQPVLVLVLVLVP